MPASQYGTFVMGLLEQRQTIFALRRELRQKNATIAEMRVRNVKLSHENEILRKKHHGYSQGRDQIHRRDESDQGRHFTADR